MPRLFRPSSNRDGNRARHNEPTVVPAEVLDHAEWAENREEHGARDEPPEAPAWTPPPRPERRANRYEHQEPEDILQDIESRLKASVEEVLVQKHDGVSVQLLLSRTVPGHADVRECFAELDNFLGRKVSRPETLRRLGLKIETYPVMGGRGSGAHHQVFPSWVDRTDRNREVRALFGLQHIDGMRSMASESDRQYELRTVQEILEIEAMIKREVRAIVPPEGMLVQTLMRPSPRQENARLIECFARLDSIRGTRASRPKTLANIGLRLDRLSGDATAGYIVFPD
jgi:hypothetical protein